MKLKIGDIIYLQKYEISYILHELNDFPGSLMQEILYSRGDTLFTMNSSRDAMHFETVFKMPENVKWFLDQDYILDYDEYKKKSISELEALYQDLKAIYFANMEEFDDLEDEEREDEIDKFEKLGHKILSLKYLIDMKKGRINFVFPEEYQDDIGEENQDKPSLFKRLFSRGAQ